MNFKPGSCWNQAVSALDYCELYVILLRQCLPWPERLGLFFRDLFLFYRHTDQWKQIEDPDINSPTHGHLSFDEEARNTYQKKNPKTNQRNSIFSKDGAKWDDCMQKTINGSTLITLHKTQLQMHQNLNTKSDALKWQKRRWGMALNG